MVRYNNWEDFINSGDELLNCVPVEFYIEKGKINFVVECIGKRYFCTGTECYISDIYFYPELPLRANCEFDSFYMFECDNESNQICNWG